MNPIAPIPSAEPVPRPTGFVTDGEPTALASARTDDGHVLAMDRSPDWAALAGITEYESWLRHVR